MQLEPIAITAEVFQVGGYGLTAPEDAAIYLINFDGHAALVDAGGGREQTRLLNHLATVGVLPAQIEYLLLTHCHYDHAGGAHSLRKHLGCPVVAHTLDAVFLESGNNEITAADWYGAHIHPCPVDRPLRELRQTLPLGGRTITALHIPGHSPGSLAYLIESEGKRIVFAQDVHGPLDPVRLRSNRTDYLASLERLLALNADILCEGHYGIFRSKPVVTRFIHSCLNAALGP